MAEPLPTPFQETLNSPTAFARKLEILAVRGSEVVAIEPAGGSISQDARQDMRWDGSLEVPVTGDLIPTTPGDLLTPFGTRIVASLGITRSDGSSAVVPYGVLIVDSSNAELSKDSRTVNLPLVDLADAVAGYRFEEPLTVAAGVDVAQAVNVVITSRTGVNPDLSDTGSTLGRDRIFGLDPNTDPWRELVDLVTGFGYRIYYDRSGSLLLDQPSVPNPNDAVEYKGRLTVANAFDHRPANVVVARGEASDGTPPVQAVAYDDDPSSPTYAGPEPGSSPYNRRTRYYSSPLLTTETQCALAARSILAGEAAAAATWTVTKAFDPTVDPDDILSVPLTDTRTLPLVVDSVTVDLAGETTLACRGISQLVET